MFSNMGLGETILVLFIPAVMVISYLLNKKDKGQGGGKSSSSSSNTPPQS